MQITVKNVVVENKGKYKMAVVSYSDERGDNTKKLPSFGTEKDSFLVLASAAANDVFDVDLVKEDNYWKWAKVSKVGTTDTPSSPKKEGIASPRSTYETPEERANRQVMIARQSSLDRAVEYYTLTGHKKATLDDIISLAETFTKWVVSGKNPAIKAVSTQDVISSLDNDIPL